MSFFISKHVDITGRDLREFVNMTQRGSPGCQIQHLVLVGVVNNTELAGTPPLAGTSVYFSRAVCKASSRV
jgi:hypothetical protein